MKRNGSWWIVALVTILALDVALLAGVRSAVGRAFDLAEYKAASPYYQTLAMYEQIAEGGRESGLLWVMGGVLVVILAGWLLAQARSFLREARLSYKAVVRKDSGIRHKPRQRSIVTYHDDSLIQSPSSRMRQATFGHQPETAVYDDVDEADREYRW